jgi:hypothetical protein
MIWHPESIEKSPSVLLERWLLIEATSDGVSSKHFVGHNVYEGVARVSSSIETFDKDKLTGTTYTGRAYTLVPDSEGCDTNAMYVLDKWLNINGIESYQILDLDQV